MLFKFEVGPNITETTKNICVKGKGTVDYSTVTRCVKKFCSGYKNFDNMRKSDRPNSMDSEAMLQTIEANLVSST